MRAVGVVGRSGRMGQRVFHLLEERNPQVEVRGFDRGDRLDFKGLDVVIDFSLPTVTDELVEGFKNSTAALISGVTGHTPEQLQRIDALGESHAVLLSANFSLGVHVLAHLVRQAASMLDEEFHIEIHEQHHASKRDLPSGTAIHLGKYAAAGRSLNWTEVRADRVCGQGRTNDNEIGISALRGGSVVGTHDVHFFGPQEQMTLSHIATDRNVFAAGAIRTAQWIVGKPPRSYSMDDFVNSYKRN